MQQEFITVTFNRTKIAIRCADILYVIMSDDHCRIHMFDGNVYRCRMTLKELKKQLNEEFIEVKRGCMVAVSAISDIGDRILQMCIRDSSRTACVISALVVSMVIPMKVPLAFGLL